MPAYVSRPAVVLPPHRITTAEIVADIEAHHPGHPKTGTWRRVLANSGVDTRWWTRPLAEIAAPSGVAERARSAFRDALDLGVQAATDTLAAADLDPAAVDCIVTSHTTSWTVPGLDVHLVGRLGLRPDVSRIPIATLACGGGAQALVRAVHHIQAHPDATVLVVVAEQLSTIYHADETSIESVIYKGLFGDSGSACLITGRRLGPGLRVDDTWEHVLPDSLDRYWGRIDADGLHFDSTRRGATSARETTVHLRDWVAGRPVDWAVIHPGAPGIVTDVATGLGLDPDKDGRHSLASLRESGNLGGGAINDVLRRTYDDPPAPGTSGVGVAFGPGFTAAGLYGTWT